MFAINLDTLSGLVACFGRMILPAVKEHTSVDRTALFRKQQQSQEIKSKDVLKNGLSFRQA